MLAPLVDLPVERHLESMRECLDSAVVLEICRDQLADIDPTTRQSWREARIIEALYHPTRYLRIVYALLENPDTPPIRVWPEGQLVYFHGPVRRPLSRRAVSLDVHGSAMEAYCFPDDRRLRGLRTWTRRDLAVRAWQSWLDEQGQDERIDPASLQRLLIRYVPEQKCIVRLRADPTGKAEQNGRRSLRIGIRTSSPSVCQSLFKRHEHLALLSQDHRTSFLVPRIMGGRPSSGLLAFEWLRGQSLPEALVERDPRDVMRAIVLGLTHLHSLRMDGLRRETPDHLRRRLDDTVVDLTAADPTLKSSIETITARILAFLENLEIPKTVTIHGDFHWKQLSIKRDRFVLFDLERMCLGDPLLDVANFATQLEMLGYRPEVGTDLGLARTWKAIFLEEWVKAAKNQLDSRRFHVYSVLSRLELARGMMRHLRPGWRSLARRCAELANADLEAANVQEANL